MPLQRETTSRDERVLIALAASGSHDALATLFQLHSTDVHRIAYRLTMSADDADDVVQDVFIGLPEALPAFSGTGDFAAWLRKIAVRTTLMRMRATKRRNDRAIRAEGEKDTAISNFILDRITIATALVALPEDLRIAFLLRDVDGYAHTEIAQMLGIRPGTAEVRVHRARRRLRTLLGER